MSGHRYRYEITAIEGRFADCSVGDVLVETHYRGETTEWHVMDTLTGGDVGWAAGRYLGLRTDSDSAARSSMGGR